MVSAVISLLFASQLATLSVAECIKEVAKSEGLDGVVLQPLADVTLWRSQNVSSEDLKPNLPKILDATWSKRDSHLTLTLSADKWTNQRRLELQSLTVSYQLLSPRRTEGHSLKTR